MTTLNNWRVDLMEVISENLEHFELAAAKQAIEDDGIYLISVLEHGGLELTFISGDMPKNLYVYDANGRCIKSSLKNVANLGVLLQEGFNDYLPTENWLKLNKKKIPEDAFNDAELYIQELETITSNLRKILETRMQYGE
jgi:hypothetical protein